MRQARQISRAASRAARDPPHGRAFAALDEQTRMVLGEDLSVLLAETGKTIVFVTHSLAERCSSPIGSR